MRRSAEEGLSACTDDLSRGTIGATTANTAVIVLNASLSLPFITPVFAYWIPRRRVSAFERWRENPAEQ